jgi:hypothetical protein
MRPRPVAISLEVGSGSRAATDQMLIPSVCLQWTSFTESGHHSCIPSFIYYEMIQSKPGTWWYRIEKGYTNLNDPTR